MKEKIIVSQQKFPIIQLFTYLWVISMAIYQDLFANLLMTAIIFMIFFTLLYFSFYAIEIVISEHKILRGNKMPFIKNRIGAIEILRANYKGIDIKLNEKKHFEISAIDDEGRHIVLAVNPNRLPAEELKLKFEKDINSYWRGE